jgi:hypothetical protein
MSNINPYASPTADTPYQAKVLGTPPTMWRDGDVLVLRNGAVLPPRCVKSNEPVDSTWRRKLSWHPQWVFFLILVHLLVYIVVAMIMTKRATFDFPISPPWRARRRNALLVGWGIALLAVATFVVGIMLIDNRQTETVGVIVMISSFALPFVGLIYGIYRGRLLWPQKIDENFSWIKGASPEYLASLPDWPGPYEAYRVMHGSPSWTGATR